MMQLNSKPGFKLHWLCWNTRGSELHSGVNSFIERLPAADCTLSSSWMQELSQITWNGWGYAS